MDIRQKKEELRQRLLKQRKSISGPEFYGASANIIERLKEQDEFRSADTIHCYVSMNERREVETRELIKELVSKGKHIVVPITNFDNGTLSHVRLSSYDQLETNKWGVLEPKGGEEAAPGEFDLVIVPMVGADEAGNRIGYGEGFYDRFLKEVTCPTLGLIFDQNIVESLPVEDFDIPLTKVISDKRVIHQH